MHYQVYPSVSNQNSTVVMYLIKTGVFLEENDHSFAIEVVRLLLLS